MKFSCPILTLPILLLTDTVPGEGERGTHVSAAEEIAVFYSDTFHGTRGHFNGTRLEFPRPEGTYYLAFYYDDY
ncbi:hypothetical protein AOQ84DRAFT_228307 [Glonium stellatum]|uniref:Uncharacterized protein n=1 Tax=Glonium stellatum TaxID=574774 RepID=A0A8E2F7V0_9PEZI|nr:hypothetical protein AOQ84DRAFT_228307 [Glonium stellatum]